MSLRSSRGRISMKPYAGEAGQRRRAHAVRELLRHCGQGLVLLLTVAWRAWSSSPSRVPAIRFAGGFAGAHDTAEEAKSCLVHLRYRADGSSGAVAQGRRHHHHFQRRAGVRSRSALEC